MGTVTKADIGYLLASQANLPHKIATDFVESVLAVISTSLKSGQTVKWANFATFSVKLKDARPGRNLHTDSEIIIPPRYVVVFKPSESLKYYVGVPKSKYNRASHQVVEGELETV
ncbi:MAG: integration host factor subunit alpha [Legionellales bacterium]|nr:integration host factor subunit alpha [Legionellales bacterium]|tara:strand:+ start:3403 stop:3747 length:345 start_codon:yes stop_codon:yes gene_type:complete